MQDCKNCSVQVLYNTPKVTIISATKFIPLPHFRKGSMYAALKSSLTGTLAGLVGSYCNVWTAYQS